MKTTPLFLLLLSVTVCSYGQQPKSPVDYVDPFIGSQGSRWFAFTPAALPFGLVKLAPMTYGFNGYSGGGGRSGYDYRHTSILGFSHVHEWQTGGILVMPTVGPLVTVPGANADDAGFRSPFKKANETASAGYYSVLLDKYNIKAELTATTRVGFHKYTFPESESAHIIFDTGHLLGEAGSYDWGGAESKEVLGAGIEILSPTRLQGYTMALPAYQVYRPDLEKKSIRVYFAATLSKPAVSYGCYRNGTRNDKLKAEYGRGCGAYLIDFKTQKDEAIEIQVAISFISMEQAWANLEAEATGKTFDQARADARRVWNTELSKIEVQGGAEENKVKFYTALYQVLLGRGKSSDANGKYISNLNDVKQIPLRDGKPEYNHYNNDAIWGGFSNFIQLWTLAYPEQANSYVKCMLDVYDEIGWLPDGLTCDKLMPGMESNETCAIVAAAVNRGIATFDVAEAYAACLKSETEYVGRPAGVGKDDLRYFWEKGYVPIDKMPRAAASHTLEYSYTCWVTAQLAKRLQKTSDYEKLIKASRNWENIYDPENGAFYPRNSDGTFVRPFNRTSGRGFEEGTPAQYAFYVPQDINGIIKKIGKERAVKMLDDDLAAASTRRFSGSTYNHGNEPSLLNAYVFDYLGRPDLSQKWVRAIMDTFYQSTPFGYQGADDDQGQLSGWFVLAALGLYDISGGCGVDQQLYVHTPLFPKITIHLDRTYYKSDTLTIVSKNFSDKSLYIKSATLNGAPLKELHFDFGKVNAGSQLELELSEIATP